MNVTYNPDSLTIQDKELPAYTTVDGGAIVNREPPTGMDMGHSEMDMTPAEAEPLEVHTQPDPAIQGMWEQIQFKFNHLPVHMALLHTGKVFAFGGSGNDRANLEKPFPAELWDPQTGELKIVAEELASDIFCSGHAALPDGRVLVAGGTFGYDVKRFAMPFWILDQGIPLPPFSGLEQSYLFDPVTGSWTRVADMVHPRWYPTLITLGDGRILAAAGLTKHFPWFILKTIEIYSPHQGWQTLKGGDRWLPLYPRLHLLPHGEVFYAASYNTHYVYPFRVKDFPPATLNVDTGEWTNINRPKKYQREEGSSVLLPLLPNDNPEDNYRARVLLIGGGSPAGTTASATCEIIDFGEKEPKWEPISHMTHARYYAYPVILPNKCVLVIGGRRGEKAIHIMDPHHDHGCMEGEPPPQDNKAVREPELFDPVRKTWTTMAPMSCDRLYHSNALLLPDGRVMAAGSNPASGCNELRIEIYRPPYLHTTDRPAIEEAPPEITYGAEFEIKTAAANEIKEVALIKPTVTTHCVNTEQRYVGLVFHVIGSGTLVAKVPKNRNVAPPGYYMLFIVRDGIPSTAKFIHVQ